MTHKDQSAERTTVARTPNPDCLDCRQKTRHKNRLEWYFYHPFAGHGYMKELGWTHPDLVRESETKKTK